jgi:hypothetical protein
MGKISGKACTAVEPIAPVAAEEADVADPGKMAEIVAEQLKKKAGKYGSTPAKPFKPPTPEQKEEKKEELSWIEIELVDNENNPVPGESYKVELPDGSVAEGTLDAKGFARLDGIPKGNCKVTFPDLDKNAWEKKV